MAPLFLKTVTNLRACEEHLRTCKADRSDGPPIEPAHGVRFTGDPETGLFNRKVYSPLVSWRRTLRSAELVRLLVFLGAPYSARLVADQISSSAVAEPTPLR